MIRLPLSNVITSISLIWYTTSSSHLLRLLFFSTFYYLRNMIKQIDTSYIRNTNETIYNIIITRYQHDHSIIIILSFDYYVRSGASILFVYDYRSAALPPRLLLLILQWLLKAP